MGFEKCVVELSMDFFWDTIHNSIESGHSIVLNRRKRLLRLLLKGNLDILIKSRVMNLFWQNFEKLPKRALFACFLTVSWLQTKKLLNYELHTSVAHF
jgi:hypothetical protein